MAQLNIRDLQRVSSETIAGLDGPTPIKAGDRTIGILIPLKPANRDRLLQTLLRAEALAKGRDAAADDRKLEVYGPVDKADWSFAESAGKRRKPTKKK